MGFTIFGNDTNIVHWQPSPQGRGTFDILSTCIVTILLCVWTAVHLNIPRPDEYWGQFWRKVGWMLLSFFAPEIVACTAWYQRCEAKKIMREYNETFGLEEPPSSWTEFLAKIKAFDKKFRKKGMLSRKSTVELEVSRTWLGKDINRFKGTHIVQNLQKENNTPEPTKRNPWTTRHGFYALMGGLVFHVPILPPEQNFLPEPAPETWTVTPKGLKYLLRTEERQKDIPDMTEVDIKAKSRANGLTKFIVCLQATWFCIQCVTRLAQGLPISLLELNTLGHAICALLIYVLWWKKPFDVESGTPLNGEKMLGVRALQWMTTNKTDATQRLRKHFDSVLSEELKKDLSFSLERYCESELSLVCRSKRNPYEGLHPITGDLRPRNSQGHLLTGFVLQRGQVLPGTCFRSLADLDGNHDRHAFNGYSFDLRAYEDIPFPLDLELDSIAVVRWRLAWQAMSEAEWADNILDTPLNALSRRSRNWTDWRALKRSSQSLLYELGFALAGLVYGGLHILAWHANFFTVTEQTLWRMAACIVAGGAAAVIIGVHIVHILHDAIDKRMSFFDCVLRALLAALNFFFWLSIALLYLLARMYLVVECFIGLSNMPSEVYRVPNWSAYFPHIT